MTLKEEFEKFKKEEQTFLKWTFFEDRDFRDACIHAFSAENKLIAEVFKSGREYRINIFGGHTHHIRHSLKEAILYADKRIRWSLDKDFREQGGQELAIELFHFPKGEQ